MSYTQTTRGWWQAIVAYFNVGIWQIDARTLPRYKYLPLQTARVVMLALKGFKQDECRLKASALTFLSLFSLVPCLVISFGISRALGFDIKKEIYSLFRGQEDIIDTLFMYADQMLSKTRGDVIAAVGILILFYTVMRLLHNVENIFNDIWDIKTPRSLQRKFVDYTSMLLLSPVLIFFSSSLNVFISTQLVVLLHEWEMGHRFLLLVVRFLPFTLLWLLLSLLYVIMPNILVKVRSALLAAMLAGAIFQLVQWVYINFQIGVSTYNTIYGSLAALPLFLVWLQISWQITLFGAELAFSHQNIQNYTYLADNALSLRERKYIALRVMTSLCQAFRAGNSSTLATLAGDTHIPRGLLVQAMSHLQQAGLACELAHDTSRENRYQPSMDIHRITVQTVIDKVETAGFTGTLHHQSKVDLKLYTMLSDSKPLDKHVLLVNI